MNFKLLNNTGNNVNLLILFFILCCFAVFISPAFLDFDNIQNIIRTVMVLGIIASRLASWRIKKVDFVA